MDIKPNEGLKMTYTRNLLKHGNSLAMIIPKKIVDKLGLYKGQIMVVKLKRKRIDITALNAHIDNKDRTDNNGH